MGGAGDTVKPLAWRCCTQGITGSVSCTAYVTGHTPECLPLFPERHPDAVWTVEEYYGGPILQPNNLKLRDLQDVAGDGPCVLDVYIRR